MDIQEYLDLMRFPQEWKSLDMLPTNDFIRMNIETYKPGIENAAEHDRYGFFCYWLKRGISAEQLAKLKILAMKDPDQMMGRTVLEELEGLESDNQNDV